MSKILFNSRTTEVAWLSNFYMSPIVSKDGRVWPSAEHAYQGAKATSAVDQEYVRAAPTAAQAKKRGGEVELRPDWGDRRIQIMRNVTRDKYRQNPFLWYRLMNTAGSELVHLAPWDKFWGVDHTGIGHNWLGDVLMNWRGIWMDHRHRPTLYIKQGQQQELSRWHALVDEDPLEFVYVGRGRGKEFHFGNPFHISTKHSRAAVIRLFEDWLVDSRGIEVFRKAWVVNHIPDLKGKVLVCHCWPEDCHARILAKRADA